MGKGEENGNGCTSFTRLSQSPQLNKMNVLLPPRRKSRSFSAQATAPKQSPPPLPLFPNKEQYNTKSHFISLQSYQSSPLPPVGNPARSFPIPSAEANSDPLREPRIG